MKLDRLEHKLGIRASDTAAFVLDDCRVPKENLLGSPEIETKRGFAGVMQTFDNTRPLVAGMAIGVARAALERTRELLEEAGVEIDYDRPPHAQSAAASEFIAMESDWEAARLLTLRGRVAGRQPQAELAPGLDGQGEGRPGRHRHLPALRGARGLASATARASCWRSGPATSRSSTSSRARSRSSCSSAPGSCSARRPLS